MVNSVTSSGEEDWGRLCGVIAPFTSGLYDFVFVFVGFFFFFFFARKYIYCLGNFLKTSL